MKSATLVLAIGILCVSAHGAEPAESPAYKHPSYLERLVTTEQAVAKVDAGNVAARQASLQALATARSWVGDEKGALDAWASMSPNYRRDAPPVPSAEDFEYASSTLAGFAPRPAIDTILRAAKDRQIVILNEAHHVARHRAFATLLALELRKRGFQYLAVETLTAESNAAGLLQRRYPKATDEDGYYSQEPVFGDFLRQAMRAGYVPVAYEWKSVDIQDAYLRQEAREDGEAENLNRVLGQNPGARMFIFVGYAHAYKGMSEVRGKPLALMAERLRAKTGIDPLVIEQTRLIQPATSTRNPALIDAAFKGRREESLILVSRTAPAEFYSFDKTKADMTLFHRPTRLVKGRPDWLAMAGYRRPRPIPAELLPSSGRRLVQAFYAAEPADAVPVDQVLVSAGEPPPVFMLPKGKFRFAFQE